MSSVGKKKDIQPYWRPDYRNPSTLPDIKVVRTDFIVNFVAILLALAVGAFLLQREYRVWSISGTIDDMKQRIRLAEPDDNIFIKQSEEFRKSGRYVQDLEKFYEAPFYVHDLLLSLAELEEDDLIFTKLSFSENVVTQNKKPRVEYRMNITGQVRDLPTLDDYVVSLRNLELFDFEGYETKVAEDPRQRDATGLYPYTISVTLSPSGDKKKGSK